MKKYINLNNVGKLALSFAIGAVSTAQAQSVSKFLLPDTNYTAISTEQERAMQQQRQQAARPDVSVAGTQLAKIPVANLTNTLYGQLNGLMVRQNNGQPGYGQASLYMRGRSTYDNNTIVCYVDGFQVDLSFYFQYLSPHEIEHITLLKDPVSLATFGMKGANGVLWVTTKRAKSSAFNIDAQVLSGVQQAIKLQKPYDSYQYANLYNQAISNDRYLMNGNQYRWSPQYTEAQLKAYQDGSGTNVDWLDEALKKNTPYTDVHVNASGGISDVAKYNLFLGHTAQNGLFDVPGSSAISTNSGLRRYSIRSNVDLKFFKIFEARIDLGGRIESYRQPLSHGSYDQAASFWRELTTYPNNIYPVKDPTTGNWSGNTLYPNNPVAQLHATGMHTSHDRTLQGNFFLKENLGFITQGLYLSQSVSFNTWTRVIQNKTATYARFYNGNQATSDKTTPITFGANTPYGQLTWRQSNIVAGYDRKFGDHDLSAAFNFYASDMIPDANEDATKLNYRFQNFGGRTRYVYNDRYQAELGFGYSGSDSYAPAYRWKFYPAASLGWVASQEDFLRDNTLISYLKFRGSVAKVGNDQTFQGRYLYQQYYRYVAGSVTGNNSLNYNNGISLGRLATENITAEQSVKYEFGVDLALLNKVNINVGWFKDNRSGIISKNNLVPGHLGYTGGDMLPFQNIGKVTNQGFEFGVSYRDQVGEVGLGLDLMGTYAKNKINYQAEIPNKNDFSNSTGRAIGTPLGLIADGFYQFEDFDAVGNLREGIAKPSFGPVQPGDIKYQDLDKNGIVDNNDITAIGNPNYPKFYYSFNLSVAYKGFDLSALFQGSAGMSVNLLDASYNQVVPFIGNRTIYPIAGNAWAYYPDQGIDTRNQATFPRLTTVSNTNNYRNSSFWMKNADFLRLRSLQLSYTIPEELTRQLHLKQLKVSFTAVNPLLWSSFYKEYGLDPETTSGYPGLKSYNMGLSLNF
ncbi:SusC/RagA family TonB-linked outer membrane protein [Sphingobacterium sp. MYb382]|uniref:SusC/RagA family TonB-linked outer membrane protein n=1 Tax=Sphingobacterium sp. MYb382 TaxID=2745278 RepID=UPI0030A468BE